MLTAAGSPLVAGSVASATNMAKRIKVLRPFMWQGKATVAGEVLELPDILAFEVVSAKRAEYAPIHEPIPEPVLEPAPEPVAPKRRGSKKDAE